MKDTVILASSMCVLLLGVAIAASMKMHWDTPTPISEESQTTAVEIADHFSEVTRETATSSLDMSEWLTYLNRDATENSATSSIDTSNWLAYRNDTYGYEFRYPRDYVVAGEVPENHLRQSTQLLSPKIYPPEKGSDTGEEVLAPYQINIGLVERVVLHYWLKLIDRQPFTRYQDKMIYKGRYFCLLSDLEFTTFYSIQAGFHGSGVPRVEEFYKAIEGVCETFTLLSE